MFGIPNFDLLSDRGKQEFIEYVVNLTRKEINSYTPNYNNVSASTMLTEASLPTTGTAGTYTKVTTDVYGRVASGTTLVATDIPNILPSQVTGTAVITTDSRLIKTFRSYGAIGDGTTNDNTALQTALNTSDALILDGEGLTYKITATLSLLRSNVRIQNAIFDCSSSVNNAFTVGGASLFGTAVSLTANTAIGSNTVTVADTSTFTANQLVLLKSTAAVSNQSSLASTYGQLARVVSLTATTLTLTNASMLTFATADAATVTPISALTNVTFDRVHFVGNSGGATGAFALTATYCDNLLIQNCSSINVSNFGFFLTKCYNSTINNCNVNKSLPGSSVLGGTAFALSGSYDCSVTNSKADTGTRGIVIYSGDALTIGTRIANNVITNATREGIYLSNASVESVVIGNKVSMAANNNNNASIACYGGSSIISNNSVNDVRVGGIYYQPLLDNTPSATVTATEIKTNVKIHNNTINYLDNATGAGIYVLFATGSTNAPSIDGVIITNNTITGGATAATNISYGIYLLNQSSYSATISDVVIANNIIDSVVEFDGLVVQSVGNTGVTNLINNVKIVNNVFRGGRSGILILSTTTNSVAGVLTNFNIDNNTLYGVTNGLRAYETAITGIRYNNNKIETGSAGYLLNSGGGRITPTSVDVQTSETGHLIVADAAALTALGAMPEGTMAYQLDTNALYVYDGSVWKRSILESDTGTVTSTMILNGTILNADINASAAIAPSKISGTAIVANDASYLNPAGSILAYAGINTPTGWLLCAGQDVSRTTYATLFAALSTSFATATTTNTSTTVSGLTGMATATHVGWGIAGNGIPTGATISSVTNATTVVISAAATVTATGTASLVISPYKFTGANNTTTFLVPDLRGRTIAGKDNMNGSTASRITSAGSGIVGTILGAAGGTETHTLTIAQLATHTHIQDSHSHQFIPKYGGSRGTTVNMDVPGAGNDYGLDNSFIGGTTATNQNTGSGTAHQNTQPTIITNYIIKT